MKQYNFTQTLKVIRDLVMRNRPCYRDYLGSETVTKTVQIGSGVFESMEGVAGAQFPVTDSAFKGFVFGETYTVTIDGVTADYVARNLSPLSEEIGPIIGTTTTVDPENLSFDGWSMGAVLQDGVFGCVANTLDMSFIGKTISVSQTKTETVTRYDTKLLPEYLLPDFLRKDAVAAIKTEAQSAAAEAADAQRVADAALPKSGGVVSGTIKSLRSIEFPCKYSDNSTAGLKIGSTITSKVLVNRLESGVDSSIHGYIEKIVTYLDGITIYNPNTVTSGKTVTIAAAGERLDFAGDTGKNPVTIGAKDIILSSSTPSSNKRFRITVDDTGTLKATEVT